MPAVRMDSGHVLRYNGEEEREEDVYAALSQLPC